MLFVLLPLLALGVGALKARWDWVIGCAATIAVLNVAAFAWMAGSDEGASFPTWLILMIAATWLVVFGCLLTEPKAGSWWDRSNADPILSWGFSWIGRILLVACPTFLAVAYAANENVGGVVTMGLFALLVGRVFLLQRA